MPLVCYCHIHNDRSALSRMLELAAVTCAAVGLIGMLGDTWCVPRAWIITPGILVIAAFLPTLIHKTELTGLCLNPGQLGLSLRLLGMACLVAFPALWGGLCLLQHYAVAPPLEPYLAKGTWPGWIAYQFMYVAVAEEIFFRGYLQGSLLRLKPSLKAKHLRIWQGTTIVISAAAFAIAHTILLGNILSVLTFFPGLILGWLFLRTRSLLAPILFHGLANTAYAIMASLLI